MPDTPGEARFLTDQERKHALERMRLDSAGATTIDVDDERFNWHWVRMALMAPQTYFNAIIWFFLLIPLYVSLLDMQTWIQASLTYMIHRASPSSFPPSSAI
jgi:hypothetical protein